MPTPTSTGAFSSVLAPGLRKIYTEDLKDRITEYDKIAHIVTSKRNYEDDLEVALLGTTPKKIQGGPTTFDNPIQGSSVRYTHVSYGLGFRVTREMQDDDLYDVMKKASKDLSAANAETVETTFWSIFNNATDATVFAGFDGLALASTAHTLLGGGTYANRPTTDVQLSVTALQAAVESFEKMVNGRNRKILAKPWRVIIPVEQKWIAREILGSAYKPYSSNNEINSLIDEELSFFVCHYATDTNNWALIGRNHDWKFFWRKRPVFENGDDFGTGDAMFKTFFRCVAGFGSWRETYFTAPA